MNEYSCMHKRTDTNVWECISPSDTFIVRDLILLVQRHPICAGHFLQTSKSKSASPKALLSVLMSYLREHGPCVLMLSVSSKKTHNMGPICINFQMESVQACSATVPVCLKSAKAL